MRIFIIILSLVMSSLSFADKPPFLGCNNVGCIGKFGSIYLRDSGDVSIMKPDGINSSGLTCTLEGDYFTLKRTHPSFNEIYSSILAAQLAQKTIYLRALPNTPNCEIKYVVIYP